MYQIKLTSLSSATSIALDDIIEIVDISDPAMGLTGTNKKATIQLLANSIAKNIDDGAIISANSTSDALRITQRGLGNAIVVEDSPENPDSTPFVVNTSGNVGIGTTNPTEKLTVAGNILMNTTAPRCIRYSLDSATSNLIVFGSFSNTHLSEFIHSTYTRKDGNNYVLNASEHDTILMTGQRTFRYGTENIHRNFLIGGTPSSPSAVTSGSVVASLRAFAYDGTKFSSYGYGGIAGINLCAEGTQTSANAGGYITFNTMSANSGVSGTNLERMRINSAGYVGIGVDPTYQLHLSTNSAGKPGTGGLWTVTSDERLKENIELADLDICYNAIKSIPLKRYKWKDDVYSLEQIADRNNIGWIAQDVQSVFPKAVEKHKFVYNQVKDKDGNIISENIIEDCLNLNGDQIYAALFGAVQKLIAKVESLESKIDELENA